MFAAPALPAVGVNRYVGGFQSPTRLQRARPGQGRRARAAPPRWRRPPLGEGAAGDSGGLQILPRANLGGMPKRLR